MADPFAFFGLTPETSERELKRAYARMVREHRPDRDPEGFRRVQEAYEAALERLAADATAPRARREPRPAVEDLELPGVPPAADSGRERRVAERERRLARLRDDLRAVGPDAPALPGRHEIDRDLIEAIRRSGDDLLMDFLACRSGLSCADLVRLEPVEFALELVDRRVIGGLLAERGRDLAEELLVIAEPGFQEERLGNLAAAVARALVIDDPESARRLEPLFALQTEEDLVQRYDGALPTASAVGRWLGELEEPEPLGRILRLAESLTPSLLAGDLLALANGLRRRPRVFLEALDRLKNDPPVLEFVWRVLAEFDAEDPREPDRRRRRRARRILRGLSGFWRSAYWSIHQPLMALYGLLFIVVGTALWSTNEGGGVKGWIARLALPIVGLAYLTGLGSDGEKTYRRHMRRRIVWVLVEENLPIECVDELMPGRRPLGSIRGKLRAKLEADRPVQTLALVLRASAAIEYERGERA